MPSPPVILSIAGFDPSSGAGVTADIKTAAAHGCYALTCITALTVQNTQGVFGVEPVSDSVVAQTLEKLAQDFEIKAVRIGMLGSGCVAGTVADFLTRHRLPNIVLDPVIRSSSGADLLDSAGLEVLRKRLLPLCDVITPNLDEAAQLTGADIPPTDLPWEAALPQRRDLARKLHGFGSRALVITGGDCRDAADFLSYRQGDSYFERFYPAEHLDSRATHGTGCAFATSLACRLAKGMPLSEAVEGAKEFVRKAIETASPLGHGRGPMNLS